MGSVQTQANRGAGDGAAIGRLTNGLGWFSIGLGLAEVIAPGAVAGLIGVRNRPRNEALLRLYGLRELAAGIGILTQTRPAGWVWARVAGDAVDLSSLVKALGGTNNNGARIAFAMASVAGVTAADVYCAKQLSAGTENGSAGHQRKKVARTIIVDRPIEEVYTFWRNFENLPRFMTYLESVFYTGDRRTHWVAKGPAGAEIDWDAETMIDEPNRIIGWKSLPGSKFENSGSVRFEPAPGGRGTLVRVDFEYSSSPGAEALAKLLRMDIGRRIMHDLRNFKQVLEIGEVTQSEASIHSGMHPAQPEPVYQH